MYVSQDGIFVKIFGLTIECVEFEHDIGVGVYRFYDETKEIATIDDSKIKEEDIIIF